ncbi:hypothetical protein ACE14D_01555 [Streptomyces sp. Act-28]
MPLASIRRPGARGAEGTVRLPCAFRGTTERGEPLSVPVRPVVAASLVGVAGAESPVDLPAQSRYP